MATCDCYRGRVTTDAHPALEQQESLEARILDAALVRFEKVGVKKTTIEDIARQAGVDRVTVYRRIGSRDDVVQAVTTREVAAVLAEMAETSARHDTIEGLISGVFVVIMTRWRTHPVVSRMLTLEPDRLMAKLTTEGEETSNMGIAAMVAMLDDAVRRGLLPASPDLATRAELLCRVIHSFLVAPYGTIALQAEAELVRFARTYLVPLVKG